MRRPQVYVIMSVFNGAATLEESVYSVLKQSYNQLHLILVNDGSEDGSAAIIDRMAQEDERVLVIHKENSGLGDSRNAGIALAHSKHAKFIAFCDADDVWLSEKLEMQMQIFDAFPDADVVVTDTVPYEGSEDFQPESSVRCQRLEQVFEMLCLQNFTFQPVTSVIRSHLFSTDAVFTHDHSGQDYYPFLRFAYEKRQFYKVENILYRERQLAGSLQRSLNSAYLGGKARVLATQAIIELDKKRSSLSYEEHKTLRLAHDQYCRWMLHGARKVMPYLDALSESWKCRKKFYNKVDFVEELTKTIFYPCAVWLRKKRA